VRAMAALREGELTVQAVQDRFPEYARRRQCTPHAEREEYSRFATQPSRLAHKRAHDLGSLAPGLGVRPDRRPG